MTKCWWPATIQQNVNAPDLQKRYGANYGQRFFENRPENIGWINKRRCGCHYRLCGNGWIRTVKEKAKNLVDLQTERFRFRLLQKQHLELSKSQTHDSCFIVSFTKIFNTYYCETWSSQSFTWCQKSTEWLLITSLTAQIITHAMPLADAAPANLTKRE